MPCKIVETYAIMSTITTGSVEESTFTLFIWTYRKQAYNMYAVKCGNTTNFVMRQFLPAEGIYIRR